MSTSSAETTSAYHNNGIPLPFEDFVIKRSSTCHVYGSGRKCFPFRNIKDARKFANLPPIFTDGYEDMLFASNMSDINQFPAQKPSRQCGGGVVATPVPNIREYDLKIAAMRIFVCMLLNSWRKRREEIKQLKDKVDYLKDKSEQARAQIHLFNKLFRTEQKRNNQLVCQLKDSVDNITNAKTSCDDLATSVISIKADKALLEQELRLKYKDYEALSSVFARIKSDLYQALVEQRILESSLTKEKRNANNVADQKDKLINELGILRSENEQVQEKYRLELEEKNKELESAIDTINFLETEVTALQEKAERVDEFCENDVALHHEIDELQQQVSLLENSINHSLDYRLRGLWTNLLRYQRRVLQSIHKVAHLLLPATPAP